MRHESYGDGDEILGYSNRLSVAPGEEIDLMVSSTAEELGVELTQLVGPQLNPFEHEHPAEASIPRRCGSHPQSIQTGSCVLVPDHPALRLGSSFTILVWCYPTMPASGIVQGILTKGSLEQRGYGMDLTGAGRVRAWVKGDDGNAVVMVLDTPLRRREWYFLSCRLDARLGKLCLIQIPLSWWLAAEAVSDAIQTRVVVGNSDQPLVMGATSYRLEAGRAPRIGFPFNGKLASPRLWRTALNHGELEALQRGAPAGEIAREDLVASWDFSQSWGSAVSDIGPNGLSGRTINGPARAVTGPNWTGEELDFRRAPAQYGAIHFHQDDLDDAQWKVTLSVTIPREWRSGVYAMRFSSGRNLDSVPFFVRPPSGQSAAAIAVLMPTFTYVAYANMRYDESLLKLLSKSDSQVPELGAEEAYLQEHPELGPSLYDLHADGSLCCYSSRLRPIIQMRPGYRFWATHAPRHFSADLHLIGWLESTRRRYDVITDEDLHLEGYDLLRRYRTVITGSHPEYCTWGMRSALERYVQTGGRLMYLGGNGFYWVTSVDHERPHVIEVRRGQAGTRIGDSPPGEAHHSTTGEPGGIWRHRGKPPQSLVTVGFTAHGFPDGTGYSRSTASYEDSASFVFDGVAGDDFGFFGPLGGAAGDELDRADRSLGTPPSSIVLATSAGRHSSGYHGAVEDAPQLAPSVLDAKNPAIRGDIALCNAPCSGAVFAVGSIAWTLALSHDDGNNDVARVTDNVLSRFSTRETETAPERRAPK